MENIMEKIIPILTTYGLKVIGAILVLIVGRIVAGILKSLVRKAMERGKVDVSIIGFVSGMVYYLVQIFAIMAALNGFGVETASLVAVLGAVGFAVGFALQGSLSNFAAGVMLLLFRPYKAGDYIVVGGEGGTVQEVGILATILHTPDNVRILVPNGKAFGDVIKNYSSNDTRRVDLVIGIGYGSSMKKAHQVLTKLVSEESRILKDPTPQIAVSELADSSVNFVVRPWVNAADYWAVKFDLTEAIKDAFDAEGIEIPFPQVVMHKPE
jgi:small conductance mechanosensitive channel